MNRSCSLMIIAGLFMAIAAIQGCGSESTTAPTDEAALAVTREPLRSANESQVSGIRESEETGTSTTNTRGTGGTSDDSAEASAIEPEPSPLPIMEGVSPALVRDAQMYADQFGVSLEEALTRLMLQEPVGKLGADLEANESDTFAGLWIQHEPRYAVIVMFTRDGEHTISKYVQEGPLEEIIEVRQGAATLRELETAQATAIQIVKDLGFQFASGINVFENRTELYYSESTALEEALSENGLTLPAHVKILGP